MSAQRMKTAVSPVRSVRARCRWAAFRAIWSRWIDMATKTRPVSAAAPPPTIRKKSCQPASPYMGELSSGGAAPECGLLADRRGQVVDSDATDRRCREVLLHPRRDLSGGTARAAGSRSAAAGDEVVDLPVAHVLLELRQRRGWIRPVESTNRHNGVAGRELISGGIVGVDRSRDPGATAGNRLEEGNEGSARLAFAEEAASAPSRAVSGQRAVWPQAAEATAESPGRPAAAEPARRQTTTKSP